MGGVVLASRLLLVREPLRRQGGPFQGSGKYHVIEKRAVFLPCLVLFVDQFLFGLVILGLEVGNCAYIRRCSTSLAP